MNFHINLEVELEVEREVELEVDREQFKTIRDRSDRTLVQCRFNRPLLDILDIHQGDQWVQDGNLTLVSEEVSNPESSRASREYLGDISG